MKKKTTKPKKIKKKSKKQNNPVDDIHRENARTLRGDNTK